MRRDRGHHHQSSTVDVSVVIPAHNEEGNIAPLMEQFGELARKARFSFEVVVIDDGSRDRTLPRLVDAQRLHRFIKIVSLPRRRGLTEALQAGFNAARAPVIVFYPADRQFHPNDIPRMVDRLREGYDLVTGRKIGQYNKRVVSGLYNRISRWLFPSINVTDLNSVKAFRRELVDVFDYRHDWHRFWVAIAAEAGYRIGEVDVTLYQRGSGYSKFGWWRIPGGVLDLLAVKFQYHTMRRPLWYFGMTGTILFVIGLVIGGWAFYMRFFLNQGYRPLLYLVVMLGISSVIFFTLGFLAEAIAGVRQRVESLRGGPRFQLYHPSGGRPDSGPAQAQPQVQKPESEPASSTGDSRARGPRNDRRHGGDRRRNDRRPRSHESATSPGAEGRPRNRDASDDSSSSKTEHVSETPPDRSSRIGSEPRRDSLIEKDDLFDRPAGDISPSLGDDDTQHSPSFVDDAREPGPAASSPEEPPAIERPGNPFGRRNRR